MVARVPGVVARVPESVWADIVLILFLCVQSEAVTDNELRRALQIKLDKMKTECDKMTEQLSTSEASHAQLLRKYHNFRKELDVKVLLILSQCPMSHQHS